MGNECGQAIAALKGGVSVAQMERNPDYFEEFVEAITLREYLALAEQGYPILPQEVSKWVSSSHVIT